MEVGSDEAVDPERVGGEGRAILGRQFHIAVFGDPAETQLTGFAIEVEHLRPDDFRQVASGQAPQAVHLPKAVLGGNIPLGDEGIFLAGGVDVRHPECIERYRGGCGHGRGHGAGALRQGAPDIPIERREHGGYG